MDTAIRFTFNAIKVGKAQALVFYFVDADGRITVQCKGYDHFPAGVRQAFTVENRTDMHTDYFDKDRIDVLPSHDRYRDVASAALVACRRNLERSERYEAKIRAADPRRADYRHDEVTRMGKIVAYLEKVVARGSVGGPHDTGPVPTIADDARAEREARVAKIREEAEQKAADRDHAAADADRAARLAASMADVPLTAAQPAPAPAPRIVRVTIKWSENNAVALTCPDDSYATLDSADKHLAACFLRCPPPVGGGYDKTAFEILWDDQMLYEGRVDVRAVDVATHSHSLIRTHVETFNRNRVAFYGAPGREWVTEEMRDAGIEMCHRLGIEVPPTGEQATKRPALSVISGGRA